MQLFAVNRYNEDETLPPETDLLKNLLKKVEKRKIKRKDGEKLKEVSEQLKPTGSDDEPISPKRKQKKSESKSVEEDVQTTTAQQNVNEAEDNTTAYKVLGDDISAKQRLPKTEIVLPPWLAHPTIISTNLTDVTTTSKEKALSVDCPYLAPHILQSLKEMKVTRLFPVQSAVVPWIIEAHNKPPPFRPRDLCVSAPTGSGKTLAFAVPIVQLLAKNHVTRKIRALIVLPVAELAMQVFKVMKKLCEKTDLNVLLLSQQTSFATEQANLVELYKEVYHSKVDIVVTTPGRLVDHLHSTKGFCLKSLKFLIIDEADRIMDAMFQNWFYHLDAHVRNTSDQLLSGRAAPLCYNELELSWTTQPHKLLFSATLSQDPEKLQNMRLFQPKLFTSVVKDLDLLREHFANAAAAASDANINNNGKAEARSGEFIGKYTTPAELTEKYCITESNLKPLTLYALITEQGWTKFLCFTNSGEAAMRLTFVLQQLSEDVPIEELSGNMTRKARANCLTKFASSSKIGLVCSDAMARGIDVDVDVVICYDPPRHIKTYIHRIGRTARAGRPGTAVTLLTVNEHKHFDRMLLEVGKKVTEEVTVHTANEESYAKSYTEVLSKLQKKLQMDKAKKAWAKRAAKSVATTESSNLATLPLMQKLQLAVDNAMQDEAKARLTAVEIQEKASQKRRKKKATKGSNQA